MTPDNSRASSVNHALPIENVTTRERRLSLTGPTNESLSLNGQSLVIAMMNCARSAVSKLPRPRNRRLFVLQHG